MGIPGMGLPTVGLQLQPNSSVPLSPSESIEQVKKNAEEVATHFEGVFMSMIIKEMRATLSEGLFAGEASDTFGALFDLHMGQHMAERGGLGIGEMVAEEYRRNATQSV